jgi:3-phosphoshikimate 1-carboxyvinyltransferase
LPCEPPAFAKLPRGAEELRVKETDRIAAVSSELKKMGASVEEQKDGLIIRGRSSLKGAPVKSYDDHRMAMSLAVAALVAEGDTRIEAFDCIGISYPGFPSDLKAVIRS